MSHQPPLLLGGTKLTGIGALREKKTRLGRATRLLTSLGTTAVLGATLATLVAPAATARLAISAAKQVIPKTLGGKVLGITVISALTTSPRLRKFVKTRFNPIKTGQELGRIVEDPSKLFPSEITPTGVGEKIKDVLTTAGLIGGAAAAGVGAVILSKKFLGKLKGKGKSLLPGLIPASPIATLPLGASGLPALATIEQPLGAVQKPVAEEKEIAPMPSIPPIKIINKPETNIDIRFSKKRSFINQQVLIK